MHELVEEELKNEKRNAESEDKKERKDRKDRQKSYTDIVRNLHAPKIDPEKLKEITTRTNELIMPRNFVQKLILKNEI